MNKRVLGSSDCNVGSRIERNVDPEIDMESSKIGMTSRERRTSSSLISTTPRTFGRSGPREM